MADVGAGLFASIDRPGTSAVLEWLRVSGEDSAAQAADARLGTEYKDNPHNDGEIRLKKRPECKRRYLVESGCGHGNVFWWAKSCDSWKCPECTSWRVETEIKPEIRRAVMWARSRKETLKFITPTWRSSDLGAQPTPEGKRRRMLDRQHLIQALRRDRGLFFEYARVPEQHKSGKFHEHWLVVTDVLDVDELQGQWLKHTRGSSFNVKVQAVALRCPKCWPGRGAARERKNKSRIVPPPGAGHCKNCGFRPDWEIPAWWEQLADQAAAELSKYLVKTAANGITGKLLSRSKGWREHCVPKDEELFGGGPTKGEVVPCDSCGVVHSWRFIGAVNRLAVIDAEYSLTARLVIEVDQVYRYGPEGPCGCWSTPDEKPPDQSVVWNVPGAADEPVATDETDRQWEVLTQANFLSMAKLLRY